MTIANNKRKGANAECRFLDWLLAQGYAANRIRLNGVQDEGDIHIARGNNRVTVIEVKAANTTRISEWLRELDEEIDNAAERRPGVTVDGYLVVRPRGVTDPGRWWRIQRTEVKI